MTLDRRRLRAARRWGARGPARRVVFGGLLLLLAPLPRAESCGGTPPALVCGRTYVFGSAGPLTALADRQSDLPFVTNHFLNLINDPSCVSPPYGVVLTITNSDDPGTPLELGPFDITQGFTEVPVTVPIASGPTRVVDLTMVAEVQFVDGKNITQTVTKTVCVVEAAAGNPDVPRIEISVVGDDVQGAHPGDEATVTYALTNQDQVVAGRGDPGLVQVVIQVELLQLARKPYWVTDLDDALENTFALADPVGDNYPIAFEEILGPNCVPLPTEPSATPVPMIEKVIDIAPGETVEVPVRTRSWGGCETGCSASMTLTAREWVPGPGRGTTLFGCRDAIFNVDRAIQPQFACPPFSGRSADVTFTFLPQANQFVPRVDADATPGGTEPFAVDFSMPKDQIALMADGNPFTPASTFATVDYAIDGRVRSFYDAAGFFFPSTVSFDLIADVFVPPDASSPNAIGTSVHHAHFAPNAPSGFSTVAPFVKGAIDIDGLGVIDDAHLKFLNQFAIIVTQNDGQRSFLELLEADVTNNGTSYQIHLAGQLPISLAQGAAVTGLTLISDLRAFAIPFDDAVGVGDPALPQVAPPLAARPNPARSQVRFLLGERGHGDRSVTIYDVSGRAVRELVAGTGDLVWQLLDTRGGRVSPGVYFVRLVQGGRAIATEKVHVLR